MNAIKIKKKNTLIVAHRGLSGLEVENTCSAFIAAGNRSYYGIETDIHRTADGRFVVCHDNNLKRLAGVEIDIESSNFDELQKIILFDEQGTKSRKDLRLCSLENYISICKRYEKHGVLELKSDFTKEEISQIIDIIKDYKYLENVTFISFVYENLIKVRQIEPKQAVQYLFGEYSDEMLENVIKNKMDVDVYYKALTKESIDFLHSKGLRVNCWTVDNKADAEQLAEWGVDFITTNILE